MKLLRLFFLLLLPMNALSQAVQTVEDRPSILPYSHNALQVCSQYYLAETPFQPASRVYADSTWMSQLTPFWTGLESMTLHRLGEWARMYIITNNHPFMFRHYGRQDLINMTGQDHDWRAYNQNPLRLVLETEFKRLGPEHAMVLIPDCIFRARVLDIVTIADTSLPASAAHNFA